MRKNKIFQYVLILLSFLMLGLFTLNILIRFQSKRDSNRVILKQEYIRQLELSLIDDFKPIKNIELYSGNDTTKICELYNLIKEPCIVYRFSGKMCNECIEFGLQKLIEYISDFEHNNRVLIICDDTNPRIKNSYFGKTLYSFSGSKFNLSIEHYAMPYLFIIDNDKKCKHLFIPDKTFPELTDSYLKIIQEKYF